MGGSEGGHDGFTGTDIALEQAVHRQVATQVLEDFPGGAALGGSELKGEAGDESAGEVGLERQWNSFEALVGFAVELRGEDKFKKFFVGEVAAGGLAVGVGGRKMGGEEGFGAGARVEEIGMAGREGEQVGNGGELGAETHDKFAEEGGLETAASGVERLETGGLRVNVGG